MNVKQTIVKVIGFFFLIHGTHCGVSAQEDVPFKARYFRGHRREFETAAQAFVAGQKLLKEAARTQSLAVLREAMLYLRSAEQFNSQHYELNYLLGLAHYDLSEYDSAIFYLKRLPFNNPKVAPEASLLMAASLRRMESYTEALPYLDIYFRRVPTPRPLSLISGRTLLPEEEARLLRLAADMKSSAIPYKKLSIAEAFSSLFAVTGLPLLSADGRAVLFTGLLKGKTTGALLDAGLYWLSTGHFESLQPADSTFGEFQFTWLSDDASHVVGYHILSNGDRELFGLKRSAGGWEIWELPTRLSASPYQEVCGAFSSDLSVFYFVSDRPGGLGGFDIYACRLLPSGSWSAPRNLGRTINTEKNEAWVFPHYDGETLFFTSEGHNSIGGLDIFYSRRVADVWAAPVNPGTSLNSPFDEKAVFTDLSAQKLYVLRINQENNQHDALTFFRPHDFSRPVFSVPVAISESSPLIFNLSFSPEPGYDNFPAVLSIKIVKPFNRPWPSGHLRLADSTGRSVREILLNSYPSDTLICTWPSGQTLYLMVEADGFLPWIHYQPSASQPRFGSFVWEPELRPLKPGSIYRFHEYTVRQALDHPAVSWLTELELLIPWLKSLPGLRLQFLARIPEGFEKKKARAVIRRLAEYLKKKGIELMRFEVDVEEDETVRHLTLEWRILKV